MNIIFRVDSHKNIGAGHAMRCISLAEEFLRQNYSVIFLSKNQIDFVKDILKQKKIELIEIDENIDSDEEIVLIKKIIIEKKIETLILDGYQFDNNYQKKLKENNIKFAYITDYSVEHSADFLICPTPGLIPEIFKGPADCQYFIGHEYVFLRDEIIECKNNFIRSDRQNLKIVIAFGASFFSAEIIRKFVEMFEKYFIKIEVNFIVGINSVKDSLEKQFCDKKNKYLFTAFDKFHPEIMADADLAITTASTMFWEFNYFEIPAIIFFIADNQKGNTVWLENNNVAVSVGNLFDFDEENIKRIIQAYIINIMNGLKCRRIVDAIGKKRILKDIF